MLIQLSVLLVMDKVIHLSPEVFVPMGFLHSSRFWPEWFFLIVLEVLPVGELVFLSGFFLFFPHVSVLFDHRVFSLASSAE